MFDKLKELYDLKKVQDRIKKEMEAIFVEREDKGVKVLVRGDRHIERIEINGDEDKRLKDVINDAMKDVEKKVEKKMRGELSGLGIPGL